MSLKLEYLSNHPIYRNKRSQHQIDCQSGAAYSVHRSAKITHQDRLSAAPQDPSAEVVRHLRVASWDQGP